MREVVVSRHACERWCERVRPDGRARAYAVIERSLRRALARLDRFDGTLTVRLSRPRARVVVVAEGDRATAVTVLSAPKPE